MRAVPRLCEFYPGICLKTEEKAWENLSQGKKSLSQVKKNLSQSKKPQSIKTSVRVILPSVPLSSQWPLAFKFSLHNVVCTFLAHICAIYFAHVILLHFITQIVIDRL